MNLLPPMDVLVVLFYAADVVFMAWPVILLFPLERRRGVLSGMIGVWFFLVFVRLVLVFLPPQAFFAIIPEPLNTILFLAAGLLLLFLLLVRRAIRAIRNG